MVDEPEAERPDVHEDEEGGPVKSFLEHLEDLRWVLIKSVVALGMAMLICLMAGNHVVLILKRPLDKAKISYPGTNQVLTLLFGTNQVGVFPLAPEQQAALNLGTNRFVAFHVAFYGGMVLASPFIFYFIATFVFPALKMREKKYVYRGLGFGVSLFLFGVAFCYFALMPIALAASQKYSEWLGFSAFQWKADDYISFVCKFMLGMGLGFEMPVVILTMVKIGILNYRILAKGRKYMIVINLILGALLTTPEVITQVLMALPLQLLFEASVWITWFWERRDRKRAEREGM